MAAPSLGSPPAQSRTSIPVQAYNWGGGRRARDRWAGAPAPDSGSVVGGAVGPRCWGPPSPPPEARLLLGLLPALNFQRQGKFIMGEIFCRMGISSCLPYVGWGGNTEF